MNDQHEKAIQSLAQCGLSPAEFTLFSRVHYGAGASAEQFSGDADSDPYSIVPTTGLECRLALADCFAKGWLRVIDDAALQGIVTRLRAGGILGPVYGLPVIGAVDFTDQGAARWLQWCALDVYELNPKNFAFEDMVHCKTAQYFASHRAAISAVDELSQWPGTTVSQPVSIGPWRAEWWLRCDEGYSICVEERMEFCGRGGSKDNVSWWLPTRLNPDPARLRQVLASHHVSEGDWFILSVASYGADLYKNRQITELVPAVTRCGIEISEEQAQTGLANCLQKGWVTLGGWSVRDTITELLKNDSTFCPIPLDRHCQVSNCFLGFTLTGAERYLAIVHDWLGVMWDADLHAERVIYRKIHHYSRTMTGIINALQKYPDNSDVLLAKRIDPLGPWCVSWWEQFPEGYRLEVELGKLGEVHAI